MHNAVVTVSITALHKRPLGVNLIGVIMASNEHKCYICDEELIHSWTCRGDHLICLGCHSLPPSVFFEDGNVSAIFIGGPCAGKQVTVRFDDLYRQYKVSVQDGPTSPTFHYVNYIFNWYVGYFVLDK